MRSVDDRFRLHDEGPVFINSEGELFSIIIAVDCNDHIEQVREANEGIEVKIKGHSYTSHLYDEVVLVNRLRTPTYLFYRSDMKLKKILSIATNRRVLHWQFDQLQGIMGAYHLRKSTLIPGHITHRIPRC
jgi:hypothetical protein